MTQTLMKAIRSVLEGERHLSPKIDAVLGGS